VAERTGPTPHLPRRRAGRVLVVLLALTLATGVGVGAVFAAPAVHDRLGGFGWFGRADPAPIPTTPPPAPITPALRVRPLTGEAPVPTPVGLTAALSGPTASPVLGELGGQVLDPATGAGLWSRNEGRALVPGSTAKLVTASAALLALDHDSRLETEVVAGDVPGTAVLVGGGDPTLSALPAGRESVYPGAPRLDDLVAQVRAAVPGGVSRVQVDVDRYAGDALGPGWLPADVPAGFVAPIVPVMLDGGRAVPAEHDAPRTGTPALAAAAELARRLGADPAGVAAAKAPPNAKVLGVVRSAPIRELVGTALSISDNVLAEALARQVAVATGAEPSFAGATAAVHRVLTENGIDIGGLHTVDGSGLSNQNRVTAAGLAALLAAAATPATHTATDDRGARLRPLVDALPVAGGSGTLTDRYAAGPTAAGRGYIRAKTGTLEGVNSLAGIVIDADGRLLVFALLSNGPSPSSEVRPALDVIASALRACGCR
jgi:serine-type D-Ala-D-Ala carboxypeptidase/endopeptidase (penicillin-binding protein 4)